MEICKIIDGLMFAFKKLKLKKLKLVIFWQLEVTLGQPNPS